MFEKGKSVGGGATDQQHYVFSTTGVRVAGGYTSLWHGRPAGQQGAREGGIQAGHYEGGRDEQRGYNFQADFFVGRRQVIRE